MEKSQTKKNKSVLPEKLDQLPTEQILKEIAKTVNKGKDKRLKTKSHNKGEILTLDKGCLVSKSKKNADFILTKELATLKSLIQKIVRDEIFRLKIEENKKN